MADQPDVTHPGLRDELQEMMRLDQEWLLKQHADPKNEELKAHVGDVFRQNTERMREIVDTYSWPTRAMVGQYGYRAAWVIVQHSDHDPEFLKNCLALMTSDGAPVDLEIAYLTDRVRIADDRAQVYGTQFGLLEDGTVGPLPIEDIENLEERRASVGLEPMAEYAQLMAARGKGSKTK